MMFQFQCLSARLSSQNPRPFGLSSVFLFCLVYGSSTFFYYKNSFFLDLRKSQSNSGTAVTFVGYLKYMFTGHGIRDSSVRGNEQRRSSSLTAAHRHQVDFVPSQASFFCPASGARTSRALASWLCSLLHPHA